MSPSASPSPKRRKLIPGALTNSEVKTALYQYERLEGENDIRLVVLPPGSFYSSIRCDLIHVDLGEAPEYEALSYTWADENGDKSLTGAIFCGSEDRRIPITRNCEGALRHLRLESETRLLWIDAICIDQTTLGERNHQVSIMSKIYRTASRVVVYLGDATPESDELIYFLRDKMDAQPSAPPLQQARSIFLRPWFTRLWVFQEIMLARRAVVMCGDKTIRWRKLADFYIKNFNREHNTTDKHYFPKPFPFSQMLFQYGLKGAQPIETLPELFHATQQGNASDPRDKVFSLLGVFEKDNHSKIIPDYGLSEMETFESLAVYFVERFGIVFPTDPELVFDTRNGHLNIQTTYPWKRRSWVFDWSRRPPMPIHVGDKAFFQDTKYGSKRLIIRGQRVTSGFAERIHETNPSFSGIGPTIQATKRGIEAWGTAGSQEGNVLVRVSEYHCILLRFDGRCYGMGLACGVVQRCRSHDNDTPCEPDCSPRQIRFGDDEDFEII